MESPESEEIRRCLKPIFLSSWLFSVPRITDKFLNRVIHSVINIAIQVTTFAATFHTRVKLTNGYNTVIAMSYLFSQIITLCTGIGTIVFWAARGARALENSIKKLAEVDIELKDLGMKVEEGKIIRRQITSIFIFFNLWFIIVILNEYVITLLGSRQNFSTLERYGLAYSSDIPHLPVLFGELAFSAVVHIFFVRFQWINKILKKSSRDEEHFLHRWRTTVRVISVKNYKNFSSGRITSTEELLVKIDRLCKAHQRLCEIMEEINSSFSWQLYFAVSVIFSLIIYRLLIIYSIIFLPVQERVVKISIQVIWMVYYLAKFWMVTFMCLKTSSEANRLGIMLHGLAINDKRYHRMLHEYSIQLSQNNLHFTAGGCFPIDLSLVNSLVSHITTYILFAVHVWMGTEKNISNSTTEPPTD